MAGKQAAIATTSDLIAAMLVRYTDDAWALLTEVPDGTGFHKTRRADAIAMSLWPSRGLVLHGHELKASRNDWLRELKKPSKAESICRFCDHWWIVAGSREIVRDDELPPTWGLLVYQSGSLVTAKQAPRLEASPVDRPFLAGLLRAATKIQSRADADILRSARQTGYDEGFKAASKSDGRLLEEIANLKTNIDNFQKISGVRINQWDKSHATALRVKEILATDSILNQSRQSLENVKRSVRGIVAGLKQAELIDASDIEP